MHVLNEQIKQHSTVERALYIISSYLRAYYKGLDKALSMIKLLINVSLQTIIIRMNPYTETFY